MSPPKYLNFSSHFDGRVVNIYSVGLENENVRLDVTRKNVEGNNTVLLTREAFDHMLDIFTYLRQLTEIIADGRLNTEQHRSTVYTACQAMELDHFKTFREVAKGRWVKGYASLHFKEFASLILYVVESRKRKRSRDIAPDEASTSTAGQDIIESRPAKSSKVTDSSDQDD